MPRYRDKSFESKTVRRVKKALGAACTDLVWIDLDKLLRLALQNCKPTGRKINREGIKPKGIPPNARHVMDILLLEACDARSVFVEFRNKTELAARCGLHPNELREAIEDLRDNGKLIAYEDFEKTQAHKIRIMIQRDATLWQYEQRVDLENLITLRASMRFETDPQERALEYEGVVLQGFEPSLQETQYRNALDAVISQLESEEVPSICAEARARESKGFPSDFAKPEELPSIPPAQLTVNQDINLERLNGVPAQRLTASSEEKEGAEKRLAKLHTSKNPESRMLARIGDLVGAEDLEWWGGDWRVNWLRKYPWSVIDAAINDVRSLMREGKQPNSTVAMWLKDVIKRFAGSIPKSGT